MEHIEAYRHSKAEWLKSLLSLSDGISSQNTISSLFARLEPFQLKTRFVIWITMIAQLSAGKAVSIDGKCARCLQNKAKDKERSYL